jgi:hypothetical protein
MPKGVTSPNPEITTRLFFGLIIWQSLMVMCIVTVLIVCDRLDGLDRWDC